jgi:serine/threonine-protein kinase
MSFRALSFTEEERAFLQQRVALFFKFIFLIALIPDLVQLLFIPETLLRTGVLIDKASTLTFGVLWLLCRRGRRSVPFVLAVEWIGLAMASLFLALMGRYLVRDLAPFVTGLHWPIPPGAEAALDAYVSMMVLFGGSLLFVIRAAFVPSPPLRTFTLTMLLGIPYLAIPHFLGPGVEGSAPPLRTLTLTPSIGTVAHLLWWTFVATGAAAISHVIYGLRTEVREARRLGQYTLESKLGEGGMGVVYRARHGMMRRPTAVKLLKPEHAAAANLKRFEREVQLTARLTHPHTITIFDYGRTPDGVFYYAMELLDGASLDRVVSVFGPLRPSRVVHILYHVAEALTEAHDVGLIHRDIKPANVILCRQGGIYDFPKVVDFGLVKDLERGGGDLTRADVVAGTPLYLSPEAINAPDTLSGQSDLYSLGAVGYFALTGSSVFRGKTLVEVCSHHLHTAPEPPSKRLDRAVPADLEALILECLAKDPTERPAGAHELRRRLEACEGFGGWTGDQARAWWQERGEALATAPQVIEETDLTLTRQRSDPRPEV